jgi:hypothetical protein
MDAARVIDDAARPQGSVSSLSATAPKLATTPPFATTPRSISPNRRRATLPARLTPRSSHA